MLKLDALHYDFMDISMKHTQKRKRRHRAKVNAARQGKA